MKQKPKDKRGIISGLHQTMHRLRYLHVKAWELPERFLQWSKGYSKREIHSLRQRRAEVAGSAFSRLVQINFVLLVLQ